MFVVLFQDKAKIQLEGQSPVCTRFSLVPTLTFMVLLVPDEIYLVQIRAPSTACQDRH